MESDINLREVILARNALLKYKDDAYISLIRQIKCRTDELDNDDWGNQFVQNCGRDIAGEVVRNFFDTSDYNITVDQLAMRILKFRYDDDYDPLGTNEQIRKNVYNYHDLNSSTISSITESLDASREKLFIKENGRYKDQNLIQKGKRNYVNSILNEDGSVTDEYTGKQGEYIIDKNGNRMRRQEVEHTQDISTASFDSRRLTDDGVKALKQFYNCPDNFAMMDKVANCSKGDVRVFDKDGKDITHRATPEQKAEAVCERWSNVKSERTRQELIDKGYLNPDGTVPKAVKKQLINNLRHSQNAESVVVLKHTDYKQVAKESEEYVRDNIGKIVAGQVIYYAAPPIIYEMRCILQNKNMTLDNAIEKLSRAGKRIGDYVFAHLKDIFKNVTENSLKKFIKTFMDVLIGMVKSTVKKLLKIVKSLVLSTVDSVRIIATPGTTASQKADAVFNLFGITVTNIVIEILFEAIEKGAHIPEFLLKPLQILASVVCTNYVTLILQKADLFDVRYGFKIAEIKKIFEEERREYEKKMEFADMYVDSKNEQVMMEAKMECEKIYEELLAMDTKTMSVKDNLEQISCMFNVNIDFDSKWLEYLGIIV